MISDPFWEFQLFVSAVVGRRFTSNRYFNTSQYHNHESLLCQALINFFIHRYHYSFPLAVDD